MKKILISFLSVTLLFHAITLSAENTVGNMTLSSSSAVPKAVNIFLETKTGTTIASEISATSKGSGILYTIVTPPVLGSVNLNSETGEFIYTAGQNIGEDYFEYYIADSSYKSNIAKVSIRIVKNETKPNGKYIDLWDHWAEEYAVYLTENGLLTGEEVDGEFYFYPDDKMTRGQFIVWANSAFGYEGSTNDNTLPFEDTVNAPKWIIKAASGAYHNNLITGSENNGKLYFKPNDNLTRVELFTILYNVMRPKVNEKVVLDFADAETFPSWAINTLKAMKGIGILKGYEDNTLRVYGTVTRGEAAKLLYETLKNMQGKRKTEERLK